MRVHLLIQTGLIECNRVRVDMRLKRVRLWLHPEVMAVAMEVRFEVASRHFLARCSRGTIQSGARKSATRVSLHATSLLAGEGNNKRNIDPTERVQPNPFIWLPWEKAGHTSPT